MLAWRSLLSNPNISYLSETFSRFMMSIYIHSLKWHLVCNLVCWKWIFWQFVLIYDSIYYISIFNHFCRRMTFYTLNILLWVFIMGCWAKLKTQLKGLDWNQNTEAIGRVDLHWYHHQDYHIIRVTCVTNNTLYLILFWYRNRKNWVLYIVFTLESYVCHVLSD